MAILVGTLVLVAFVVWKRPSEANRSSTEEVAATAGGKSRQRGAASQPASVPSGVRRRPWDEATVAASEYSRPGVDISDMKQLARDATDVDQRVGEGDESWLELAIELWDPRPLFDFEGQHACDQHFDSPCKLEHRLVIAPDGAVLYASGRTTDDSESNCDDYAACMTKNYFARSFPHGHTKPVAVLLERNTGTDDPVFEDPVALRELVNMLKLDLAGAEALDEFDTPAFQLQYRLQELTIEAYETLADKLEKSSP